VGVGAGLATFLAYRAYCSRTGASLRWEWVDTLSNYCRAVASLSSSSALLAKDLHVFLLSDTTELPPSLRQLNRLLQSSEVQATLSCAAQALMRGVSQSSDPHAQPVVDKVLEAILSDRGRSLVGMAMGIATKNATATLCDFIKAQLGQQDQQGAAAGASTIAAVMRLLSSEQGERLLSLLVTKSMKTAVATYMESTAGYNTYEDFLSSISKQDHRDAVSTIMSRVTAAFCQEVASACLRASTDTPTNYSNNNDINNASTSRVASVGISRKPHLSSSNAGPASRGGPPPPSTLTPSSSLSSPAPSSTGEECLLSSHTDHLQQHQKQHWRQHRQTRSFELDPIGTPTSRVSEQPQPQSTSQLELQPDGDGHQALPPNTLFTEGGSAEAEVHTLQQRQVEAPGPNPGGRNDAAAPHTQLCSDACSSVFAHATEAGLESSAPHTPAPLPMSTTAHQHDPHQQYQQHQQHHCHFRQSEARQQQQHQQQQQIVQTAGRLMSPAKPVWVQRVVELVREQEVRALCLDLVTSATREATRSTLDTVTLNIRASLPLCVQALHLQGGSVFVRQVAACALLVLCLAFFVWRVVRHHGEL